MCSIYIEHGLKKFKLSKFILKLLLIKIWQNILITIWSFLKVASISSNSKIESNLGKNLPTYFNLFHFLSSD